MNHPKLEPLLEEFLRLTTELHTIVNADDTEPEQWIDVLDERQQVIDQLSALFAGGSTVTEYQRKTYLEPTYELDNSIVPMMDGKKKETEAQLANVRRSRAANEHYGADQHGTSAFGAFFDKRK